MKTLRWITVGFTAAALMLSIAARDARAQQSSVVGKYFSESHPQYYIELRPDGTFFLPGQGRMYQGMQSITGTYTVEAGQVTLRTKGESPVQAKLRGTTLIYPDGERWTKKNGDVPGQSPRQGNFSAIMDKIKAKPETGVIAKPGQPVAKPLPAKTDADEIFGFFGGKGAITGDVVSPALSEEEWGDLY